MTILLRLRVFGEVVSIIEDETTVDLEIHGPEGPGKKEKRQKIQEYLENEGILDAVLAGETGFAEQIQLDAQDILRAKNRRKKK